MCNNTTFEMEPWFPSNKDESIFVYELQKLDELYAQWNALMPNIQPFYAVKCNPEKEIVRSLGIYGANFDCASAAEIDHVLSLGISPDRILYANPCKRLQDIAYAKTRGVTMATFDSAGELEKIAHVYPELKCVFRIYANDPDAKCVLSNKFGAFEEEWEPILKRASALGLQIVGISFHIGSGASNPMVFKEALQQARKLYELGKSYGYYMNLIDIGGGFSVKNVATMADTIQKSITRFFPEPHFRFIAEPGRYFAETVATLYTRIIGVRERRGIRDYYITDSLYGSFNCILYDHYMADPHPMIPVTDDTAYMTSTIYGPTCDGSDKIAECIYLPILKEGDWLRWSNMGAYTIAGACDFNGIPFTRARVIYL